MSIESINADLCMGCGTCVNSCPMDVIRMDENTGKAKIVYPDDCMLCLFCERDCPVEAIYVSPEKKVQVITSWG